MASNRLKLEEEIAKLKGKLEEVERDNEELGAEKDKLKQAVEEKNEEIEDLRKKILNLDIQRAQEIEELRKQFEAFKRGNIVKKNKIRTMVG